jgi:maltooligosyltrehalose trehalohydrolase
MHPVLHTIATGGRGSYYEDYVDKPTENLAHTLTDGFVCQGEQSKYRNSHPCGEQSRHLAPTAFVNFLQNHDQVANHAFGERISDLTSPEALRAVPAVLLLAPMPHLLFMDQEWGSRQPFYFFCDFQGELADTIKEGRMRDFADFPKFQDARLRERMPDPGTEETFRGGSSDCKQLEHASHQKWLEVHRHLLAAHRDHIVPYLS